MGNYSLEIPTQVGNTHTAATKHSTYASHRLHDFVSHPTTGREPIRQTITTLQANKTPTAVRPEFRLRDAQFTRPYMYD